ncbi:hypothetical protein Dimus_033584 [Dionaea muscipula]
MDNKLHMVAVPWMQTVDSSSFKHEASCCSSNRRSKLEESDVQLGKMPPNHGQTWKWMSFNLFVTTDVGSLSQTWQTWCSLKKTVMLPGLQTVA